MGRKAIFPPRVHDHNGFARCYWQGEWHHLGRAGSKEAKEKYQSLIVQWSQTAPVRTLDEPTIDDLCTAYLVEQARARSGKRELERVKMAVKVLARECGNLPAKDFRLGHLEDLQRKIADGSWLTIREKWRRVKHGQPVGSCRNQVNLQIRRIRAAFRWGESRGLVPEGRWANLCTLAPLPPLSPIARDTEPKQPSTWEDVLRVAEHCPDPVAAMLCLQWHSGMRSGEVRIMRTCDLDMSGDVWTYRPGSDQRFGAHKNAWRGHTREVYLGPECQRLLRPWLRPNEPQAYLFPPAGRRVVNPCYTSGAYAHAVREASKRARVRITPNQGRHATAQRARRELGPQAASAILGHRCHSTTDHYARGVDADHAKDVARRIA